MKSAIMDSLGMALEQSERANLEISNSAKGMQKQIKIGQREEEDMVKFEANGFFKMSDLAELQMQLCLNVKTTLKGNIIVKSFEPSLAEEKKMQIKLINEQIFDIIQTV